jgi:lipopolysaccharide/colanic/teichoic acid biosynthesis glycosyltransferase
VRIGRDGREFLCFKFRTMTPLAEQNLDELLGASANSREQWELLHKLSQDPRTTPVGRFLRRYSLDELPQLFNVLRGEMSIVGPRPIVDAEIAKYGASFAHYCSVKPGLTGLWQVSGRHALTYEERVMLDARYAISKSLRGDLRILLRTVPVIVLGQNE